MRPQFACCISMMTRLLLSALSLKAFAISFHHSTHWFIFFRQEYRACPMKRFRTTPKILRFRLITLYHFQKTLHESNKYHCCINLNYLRIQKLVADLVTTCTCNQISASVVWCYFFRFNFFSRQTRHNRFSTLFFSIKVAESEKIVSISCIIDFKDIPVWLDGHPGGLGPVSHESQACKQCKVMMVSLKIWPESI